MSTIYSEIEKVDFKYSYPNNLDLKPDSELHKSIITEIKERETISHNEILKRFTSWREIDRIMTAYKVVSDEEKEEERKDPNKPISTVYPYLYAIIETMIAYMTVAFFDFPIIRFNGVKPDDVIGAILLEKVVNHHIEKFKVLLNIHTMLRDSFLYGIGIVLPLWKEGDGYQGNCLNNIDPYRFLPDPSVSSTDIQDGEFVGWTSTNNYLNLLTEESFSENLFNVKYLKLLKKTYNSDFHDQDNSNRELRYGISYKTTSDKILKNVVKETYMYINLIPKEWKLSDEELPEKWFFRVVNDSILIEARPLNLVHNKYPIVVCSPEFDGYSLFPMSKAELIKELQRVLDYLVNSHIINVRKAVNDMIVYDPMIINTNDLKDPAPGKLIRTRKPVWGKGIGDSIRQLVINDVTGRNMVDSQSIMAFMQQTSAIDDASMGVMRTGGPERLTSAEFRGTKQGLVSRLEKTAKIVGIQALREIGEFFGEHTKQLLDDDVFIKITGEYSDILIQEYGRNEDRINRGRLKITPEDIDIFYDISINDGGVPNNSNISFLIQTLQLTLGDPQLKSHTRVIQLWKHILRNAGVKNVDSFVKDIVVNEPQQQVQQQMQPQPQPGVPF